MARAALHVRWQETEVRRVGPLRETDRLCEAYMYALFDLEKDQFELTNIYNATLATPAGAKLLASLHALMERYQSCKGESCP